MLGELADLFARDYLPKKTRPSTQREWARLIRVELKPFLGEVDPAQVREARLRVRGALDRIVTRGGGETANRLHVVAGRVISWAVSRDLIDPAASGVFAGLEKPAPSRIRSGVLGDDEIRALWPVIQDEPPRETAFWEFAFRTGQRRGEIIKKAIGADFRIHDIRRTVATKLGALGITDDVVSRVLSHSTGGGGAAITRRHYNLAQQVGPTRAALQALSDHLDTIVGEKPASQQVRETDVNGRRLARRRIA